MHVICFKLLVINYTVGKVCTCLYCSTTYFLQTGYGRNLKHYEWSLVTLKQWIPDSKLYLISLNRLDSCVIDTRPFLTGWNLAKQSAPLRSKCWNESRSGLGSMFGRWVAGELSLPKAGRHWRRVASTVALEDGLTLTSYFDPSECNGRVNFMKLSL